MNLTKKLIKEMIADVVDETLQESPEDLPLYAMKVYNKMQELEATMKAYRQAAQDGGELSAALQGLEKPLQDAKYRASIAIKENKKGSNAS